jgi:hypothetical protein
MAVRLSALSACRALYPQEDSWYSFLLEGHSAAGRIGSFEKSNYLIGNRTRDLPACSVEPEPTTLPSVPVIEMKIIKCWTFIILAQNYYCWQPWELQGPFCVCVVLNWCVQQLLRNTSGRCFRSCEVTPSITAFCFQHHKCVLCIISLIFVELWEPTSDYQEFCLILRGVQNCGIEVAVCSQWKSGGLNNRLKYSCIHAQLYLQPAKCFAKFSWMYRNIL